MSEASLGHLSNHVKFYFNDAYGEPLTHPNTGTHDNRPQT